MDETASPGSVHATGETYTIGHADDIVRVLQQRTLATCAPFFLPYLRPGLAVLDCGCGPGSLTVELAERVAPGEVVGIDLGTQALDQARVLALARGVGNLRFEQANVDALPYPDASFDAVFSHALTSRISASQQRRSRRCGGC